MLEFYNIDYFIRVREEEEFGANNIRLKDSSTMTEGIAEIVQTITWDNVEKLRNYGFYCVISRTKKGKELKIYSDCFTPAAIYKAKEWKEEINIPIYCNTTQIKVPLKKVFEWENAEEAIQYLNEHGLSISGALK